MSDDNDSDNGGPVWQPLFARATPTPEQIAHMEAEHRRFKQAVEMTQQQVHDFYASLSTEQAQTLWAIMTAVHQDPHVAHYHCGVLATYLRLKHNFNAITGAPVGEALGVDDIEAFANQPTEENNDE